MSKTKKFVMDEMEQNPDSDISKGIREGVATSFYETEREYFRQQTINHNRRIRLKAEQDERDAYDDLDEIEEEESNG